MGFAPHTGPRGNLGGAGRRLFRKVTVCLSEPLSRLLLTWRPLLKRQIFNHAAEWVLLVYNRLRAISCTLASDQHSRDTLTLSDQSCGESFICCVVPGVVLDLRQNRKRIGNRSGANRWRLARAFIRLPPRIPRRCLVSLPRVLLILTSPPSTRREGGCVLSLVSIVWLLLSYQ